MKVLRQDIPETMQGFQALARAATRPGAPAPEPAAAA